MHAKEIYIKAVALGGWNSAAHFRELALARVRIDFGGRVFYLNHADCYLFGS